MSKKHENNQPVTISCKLCPEGSKKFSSTKSLANHTADAHGTGIKNQQEKRRNLFFYEKRSKGSLQKKKE